jgi:tetratricopeptide (TPR) repeat protein/TolB-like protein
MDTEKLGDRFGDADVFELFSRHDRLARDVLAEHDGLEIQRSDERFLFLFERPVDAVEFVLAYHERLAGFAAEIGVRLAARAAIHLSEIFLRENTPEEIHRGAKPFEVEGLAKLIVSRVAGIARGAQTLMTQEAYDMTRRALVGHPLAERKLHWRSHGHLLFSGVDEAVSVFQVSAQPIPAGEPLAESNDARRLEDEKTGVVLARGERRSPLLAAAALVPLIAAGAYYARLQWVPALADPAMESSKSAAAAVKPSLAILGFRNLGGDGGMAWLATALEDLLSTELAAGEDVRLIAGESVARMRDGRGNLLKEDPSSLDTLAPDTLRRIHEDFGSDFVILGSYLADDTRLTVQMKLQDASAGETIAWVRESGVATELGELTDLVFRVGNQVRSKLRLDPRREAAHTTLSESNEANRLYFSGKRKFSSFDFLGARDEFLEATSLDPSFAMAHAALARTWLTLGYETHAAESGARAYELAGDGLAREDFLLIEGTYHESTGDLASAIKTQTALWQFHPDKLEYGLRLAELQIADGRHQEALASIAELRGLPAPMNEDPQIDLAEAKAAMGLDRFEDVAGAAGRAIDKGRSHHNSPLVAQALRLRGRALVELKRLDEASADLDEALALYQTVGDDLGLGQTLISLAFMEQGQRNPSRAEEYLRQALEIFEKTGGRESILHAKHGLAYMIQRKGELTAARQLLEESLQVARGLGSSEGEAWVLDTLSFVLLQMGELARAEKMIQELIAICREDDDQRTVSFALVNLGLTKLSAGKLDEARAIFDAQYKIAEEASNRHLGALALSGLGAVYFAGGELEKAAGAFAGYMKIQTLAGDWGDQALTEPVYASTLLALGRPGEALDMAMKIADRFETAEQPLYQAAALRVAAEALWQQDRADQAREKLAAAMDLAGDCESPELRLRLRLTSIRFVAADRPREATRELRPLIFEASRFNLKPVELDALLALGEIELESDSADDLKVGRARLEALADEASRLGFGLLAHQAAARLGEALPTAASQPAASRPAAGT